MRHLRAPSFLIFLCIVSTLLLSQGFRYQNPSIARSNRVSPLHSQIGSSRSTNSYQGRRRDSSSSPSSSSSSSIARTRSKFGNYELRKQVDKALLQCRSYNNAFIDSPSSSPLITLTEMNHAIISAGRLGSLSEALEIFR